MKLYCKCFVVITYITFIFTLVIKADPAAGEQGKIAGREGRSDVITIDTFKFDKPIHDRHTDILGKDCSSCHHVKGKEVSCKKCHKDTDRKKLISMKNASHLNCIGCHREMSGPVNCIECHNKSGEEKDAKPGDAPKSEEVQPNEGKHPDKHRGMPLNKMNPVQFDHDAHGEYQENCNTCHHTEELGSCMESCHTPHGSEKGKMITAEQAMHNIDSKRSCVGCHEINKKEKECAGCHGAMEKGKNFNETCLKCHMEPSEHKGFEALNKESNESMHRSPGKPSTEEISDNDIPEKVIIDKLSSKYGAVELPHRKIIDSLMNGINNNKLAMVFHDGKKTICLGCHHNSPSGKTLSCADCHKKSSDDKDISRPGLKVAYHQQCIGCHDRMGIESPKSTGCVDCHNAVKEKTK
jgi:predicted CXXCH cytochrome family protein